jgi:ABC-type glycerol-3-phosphate transport system substrate-binding protein
MGTPRGKPEGDRKGSEDMALSMTPRSGTRWNTKQLLCRVVFTTMLLLCMTTSIAHGADKIKLTMSTWGYTEFWDLHEEGIAEFEKLHPQIDVELLRMGGSDKYYWEALMVRSAAGQMPDAFRIFSTQQTDIYRSGLALDISSFVAQDG